MRRFWPFILGVIVGIVLCAAVVAVPVSKMQDEAKEWKHQLEVRDAELAQSAFQEQKYENEANMCQTELPDFEDFTVLFDTSGSPEMGIPILNGFLRIDVAGLPAHAKPRWVIDARVVPVVVGDPGGTSIAYYNPVKKTWSTEQHEIHDAEHQP